MLFSYFRRNLGFSELQYQLTLADMLVTCLLRNLVATIEVAFFEVDAQWFLVVGYDRLLKVAHALCVVLSMAERANPIQVAE